MLVESQNSMLTTVMATQEALFNVDGAMLIEKYSHYIIIV
jgi:hypothetical protein